MAITIKAFLVFLLVSCIGIGTVNVFGGHAPWSLQGFMSSTPGQVVKRGIEGLANAQIGSALEADPATSDNGDSYFEIEDPSTGAVMYKWRDQNGQWQFSESLPAEFSE